jgi:hypothetical protein
MNTGPHIEDFEIKKKHNEFQIQEDQDITFEISAD